MVVFALYLMKPANQIESAGPSIPVEVLGLSGVPQAGDDFIIVPDERRAREVAMFRQAKHRETKTGSCMRLNWKICCSVLRAKRH